MSVPTVEVSTHSSIEKTILASLRKNINLLNSDNPSSEEAIIHRVLLFTPSIRKHLSLQHLEAIEKEYVGDKSPFKSKVLSILSKCNEVSLEVSPRAKPSKDIVDYYLTSILIYQLIVLSKYDDCYALIQQMIDHFMSVGYMDIQKEYIVSRVLTYLMLLYNHHYDMPSLLNDLLSSYRICCLHNNRILCSSLYNCILRVYISDRQYLTASHFLRTAEFSCNVSDKQFLRFSYYRALVSTVLLDYLEAEHCLFAVHKKSGGQETGPFYEEVMKLSILVKLLIGENPELATVARNRHLAPYVELARVVMRGDLDAYRRVVEERRNVFAVDGLDRIVNRLHNTVIRIALVKLSKSYSRISLAEVATILQLDGPEEACYTCMRNIRDKIIAGRIEGDYFVTDEAENVELTSQPRDLFSKRIAFCLNLRKEIIKNSV